MYYLELIEKFWKFNQKIKLHPTAIVLYFYLLQLANEDVSYSVVISDRAIGSALGLTRNTVMTARKKLQKLGIINYYKNADHITTYRLLLNYDMMPLEIVMDKTDIQAGDATASKAEEIIELTNFNLVSKENHENSAQVPQTVDSPQVPKTTTAHPTLDEFLEYSKTLEGYESSLDHNITEKYHSWKNNDWNNASGRLITNWKSSLKSLIPYMKNQTDENLSIQSVSRIKRPE